MAETAHCMLSGSCKIVQASHWAPIILHTSVGSFPVVECICLWLDGSLSRSSTAAQRNLRRQFSTPLAIGIIVISPYISEVVS